MIGNVISHYKILEKVGEGGMGIVYKAQDLDLDRLVALKFLPPEVSRDPDAKHRFIEEAKTISKLQHENICTVHEINQTPDGQLFICMTYYCGELLSAMIGRGPFTTREGCSIAIQIAQGLQHAHESNIIHGDMKPENVIVTANGVVKIFDFGLARLGKFKPVIRKGENVGTAPYMSPEQVRGELLDSRSDVWSLGVCMYEMLTGKLPFVGDYEPALLYSITTDEPKGFNTFRPETSEETELQRLKRIVYKCLNKNPEDRYRTMSELIADLRPVQTDQHELVSLPFEQHRNFYHYVKRFYWAAIFLVMAGILAVVVVPLLVKSPPVSKKSIAVLPFDNLDGHSENEYFSNGITEDVITELSKIGDLTVVSRTSVMQYKNSKKSIREIGKELNVGTILEGSVRRSGDRLRITSQLIDVQSDTHIWSETYDRQLRDVFLIQNDVAQKITQALKVTLRSDGVTPVPERQVGDITAYEYYLKAREYYYRFDSADNELAIGQFKKSIELEPNYAAALAGLADSYAQRVAKFGFSPEWIDSAITLSNKAISIDARSSEAYKALALGYSGKGWHRRSVLAYHHAVDLNPNYLTAVNNLGVEYAFMGILDSAMYWFRKSLPLNPAFPYSYYTVGGVYSALDDIANARLWFEKCEKLQPDFQYIHSGWATLYLREGDNARAFSEAMRILSVAPNDIEGLTVAGWSKLFAGENNQAKEFFKRAVKIDSTGTFWYGMGRSSSTALGYIYLESGQRDEAQNMFERSRRLDQIQIDNQSEWFTIRYDLAIVGVMEGKFEEAYDWLQKAIDLGWRDYHLAERDPLMKPIGESDKFKRMMSAVRSSIKETRARIDKFNNN
jgi:serine/threonine protein kinase/tetratricopeptide (TPR) repeat protein